MQVRNSQGLRCALDHGHVGLLRLPSLLTRQAARRYEHSRVHAACEAACEELEPLALCRCVVRLMQLDLHANVARLTVRISDARTDKVEPSFMMLVAPLLVP